MPGNDTCQAVQSVMCIITVKINYAPPLFCSSSVLAVLILRCAGCYCKFCRITKIFLSIVHGVPLVCNGNFCINKMNVK